MNGVTEFRHPNGNSYRMWDSPDKIGRMFQAGTLYERPLLDWIYEENFRGLAVDVGANIGNHTLWMAAVCGLQVVAYEPVLPHVVRANVALNPLVNVDVRPFALGETPGMAYHQAKGVIVAGTSKQSTDEAFQIIRMDDANHAPISFIKIDVEGYEIPALRGGMRTIAADRPVLAIEEWEASTTKAVKGLLAPLGYKRTTVFGGRGKAPMAIWRT